MSTPLPPPTPPGPLPPSTPPGWYPNPSGAPYQKYWDGTSWFSTTPQLTPGSEDVQPPVGATHGVKRSKTSIVAIASAALAGAVVGSGILFLAMDKPSANVEKSDTRPSVASAGSPIPSDKPTRVGTSSGKGTRENPMRIGETVANKEWQVTLGMPREASLEVLDSNQFNAPPVSGQEFWIVPVSATYIGDKTGTASTGVTVKFVGSDNKTYNDSCGAIPDPLFDVGELYPGGVAEGNTCVAIPAGMDGLWTVTHGFSGSTVFFEAG